MSTSGSDVGPTSPSRTWQPAAAGAGTRGVQDRIRLFESAGSNKARNSATSAELISTGEYKKESWGRNRDDNDFRSSRPHHHLRTFSVGGFNREQGGGGVPGFEERVMLKGSRAEMNQELNRRLQTKADELERVFAEHKRRIATKPVIEETESSGSHVRGRMYERYMEKRDARRREEQGRNREEKEAKTRAMWESVERSSRNGGAELKEWHKRQGNDPTEKEDETPSSMLAKDEEDDLQSSDGSLKSVNSKMHTYSRTMPSSSTPRISGGAAVPRPSSKAPACRSSRSLVPNSDIRKENTKPSTGISKANTHTQPINVPRSKSTSAGTSFFKEQEKTPRSASFRKSTVAPLTPLRTTKEPSVSKPFLKKGNSIGPGAGSALSKLRTSMSSGINEAPPDVVDASLDSPTGSTSSLYSQDGTRVRKKWGAAQIPFLAPDGSLKRFLHFGKKSTVGDRASVSGADYDTEIGRDLVSEQTRSSRLGHPLQSYDGFSFSEGMSLQEQQVQTARRSIPTPTNFNLRKDHLSESSPKSPRAFFSLSAFRNRGVESKLR